MVVLEETGNELEGDSQFKHTSVMRWRVLTLVEGVYTQQIYIKNPDRPQDDQFELVSEITPTRGVSRLTRFHSTY